MAVARFGQRSVVAVYPDLQTARGALSTVEGNGVDADNIRLLGEGIDRAADETDVSTRDINVSSYVGRRAAIGAVTGAVVGVIIGVIVAAAFDLEPFIIPPIAGLIFLGLFGFAVGGYATLDANDEWELTFQPETPGQAAVAVRTDDPELLEKVTTALQDSGALRVSRE